MDTFKFDRDIYAFRKVTSKMSMFDKKHLKGKVHNVDSLTP